MITPSLSATPFSGALLLSCVVRHDLKVQSRNTGSVIQHKPRARSCAATLQVSPASGSSWKLNMQFDGFFFFFFLFKQTQAIAATTHHIYPDFSPVSLPLCHIFLLLYLKWHLRSGWISTSSQSENCQQTISTKALGSLWLDSLP